MKNILVFIFFFLSFYGLAFPDAVIFSGDGVRALKNKIKFKDVNGQISFDGSNIDLNIGDNSKHRIEPNGAFLLQPQSGFGSSGGRLKLGEDPDNGSDFIGIYGHQNLTASYGLKLPASGPTTYQLLEAAPDGQLAWLTLDRSRIQDNDNDTYVDVDQIENNVVMSSASTIAKWDFGVFKIGTLPAASLSPKLVFEEPANNGTVLGTPESTGLKGADDITENYTIVLPPATAASNEMILKMNNKVGGIMNMEWGHVETVEDPDGDSFLRVDSADTDIVTLQAGTQATYEFNPGGQFEIKGGTGRGELFLYESSSGNRFSIRPNNAMTENYDLTFPTAGPTAAQQILESDASGNLSWVDTPAGGGLTDNDLDSFFAVDNTDPTDTDILTMTARGTATLKLTPENLVTLEGNTAAKIRLFEASGNGTDSVTFEALDDMVGGSIALKFGGNAPIAGLNQNLVIQADTGNINYYSNTFRDKCDISARKDAGQDGQIIGVNAVSTGLDGVSSYADVRFSHQAGSCGMINPTNVVNGATDYVSDSYWPSWDLNFGRYTISCSIPLFNSQPDNNFIRVGLWNDTDSQWVSNCSGVESIQIGSDHRMNFTCAWESANTTSMRLKAIQWIPGQVNLGRNYAALFPNTLVTSGNVLATCSFSRGWYYYF